MVSIVIRDKFDTWDKIELYDFIIEIYNENYLIRAKSSSIMNLPQI